MISAVFAIVFASLPGSYRQTAAAPVDAVITFQFDRPALQQPGYTFELHQDGRLAYKRAQTLGVENKVNPPLEVSQALTVKIFGQASELSRFDYPCASKRKGIADTGVKVVSYQGPAGAGSCTYNYTESKTLQALTDEFQSMKLMLDEGRKLETEHRYDRLALFAEMTALGDLVKDGRAIEVGLIAGTLRSLANDPDVLEKVRVKAGELLKETEPKS